MTLAHLVITLHWTQPDGPTLYDDVTIVPASETHCEIQVHQRTVQNRTTIQWKKESLYTYLSVFFSTILADNVLPQWIQIDMPLYPSVLIPPFRILDYASVMSAQLDSLTEAWPEEVLTTAVSP